MLRLQDRSESVRESGSDHLKSVMAAFCGFSQRDALLMPKAGGEVVIDHAHSLGKGIDDDGTAEIEAALFQILGQAFAHLGLSRNLVHALEAVDLHLAVDMLPDQVAEAAGFFFLDLQPQPGALDG